MISMPSGKYFHCNTFQNNNKMIICSIYRQPSSTLSMNKSNDKIFDPLLDKITSETCVMMGD